MKSVSLDITSLNIVAAAVMAFADEIERETDGNRERKRKPHLKNLGFAFVIIMKHIKDHFEYSDDEIERLIKGLHDNLVAPKGPTRETVSG